MRAHVETAVNVLVGIAAIVIILSGFESFPRRPSTPSVRSEQADSEAVTNLSLSVASGNIERGGGAKLALIEFFDYQCPYCAKHAIETLPELRSRYIEAGKLSYVFMSFPLERLHPLAFKAAEAAECAAEQSKHGLLHRAMLANQRNLEPSDLLIHAGNAGLDKELFESCLTQGRAEKINAQIAEGKRLGVSATPAFFLGILDDNGRVRLTRRIRGSRPFEVFQRTLVELLAPSTE